MVSLDEKITYLKSYAPFTNKKKTGKFEKYEIFANSFFT